MDGKIQQFLDGYFAQQGLSRTHEAVRYVEHSFVEKNVGREIEKIISGEKIAIFRVSAWLEGQKLAPLGKDGILVLADTFGKAFAVVKINKIETVKYSDVTETMTKAFALGDGSIGSWRQCSQWSFENECHLLKIDFELETELLITWFEVIFPK